MGTQNPLATYWEKRDFSVTPEPRGASASASGRLYIIQKHAARRLHYDLRLEIGGVLKSWAVPKGPSLDPVDKRLAVRTEDHPVEYGEFEGVIPKGYGAGTVMLWDYGTWEPLDDAAEALERGALKFTLLGNRLRGGFALIRMKSQKDKRENWLLVKERDEFIDPGINPVSAWTTSVRTGFNMKAIQAGKLPKKQKLVFVAPQLATLEDRPPAGDEWLHELKYDGYRIQAHITSGNVRLFTRNKKDWTDRYRPIVKALSLLKLDNAIVDGELVAVNESGHSDFARLQNVGDGSQLVYYAFDLLYLNGKKLQSSPLEVRKQSLKEMLKGSRDTIRFSDHIRGEGERVIERACAMNLEGVISKKRQSIYRSGRSRTWIKSKCVGNDEFIIAGYRRSEKARRAFSSLLLGEWVNGELRYRGRVGTGFDARQQRNLVSKMKPYIAKESPLSSTPREARDRAIWLAPELIAQIRYVELTAEGRLRHPVFLGLREDKAAKEAATIMQNNTSNTEIAGVRLSNPHKILYPDQGVTKSDIAHYYLRQGTRILKYLRARPLTLVRCPDGRHANCFYQKHYKDSMSEHFGRTKIAEKSGRREPYLLIQSPAGLIASAQLGALELHVWGARIDRIERPERIIFDLDPDASLNFADVKSAALEMREVLEAAGLKSFPLLTGGKGIHVVVPLERRRDWPDIKSFSRGLALKLAAAAPDRYVATSSKAKRKSKIFIDWQRNQRGATAIAPYSLRARTGAPVAAPIRWSELDRVSSSNQFTLHNLDERLENLIDEPWRGYDDVRQSITAAHLKFVQ